MSDLIARIRAAQVRAAEEAVIDSIPPKMKAILDEWQRKHVEKGGGCPGCGSMVFAVHQVSCPTVADDLY